MIRVLVVEDHEDSRRFLVRLLAKQGYTVHGAASATEAIGIAANKGCDLLISDVSLPDSNGLELMRNLRSRHRLKGIAVSGHVSAEHRTEAAAAGFDWFLPKPMDFD